MPGPVLTSAEPGFASRFRWLRFAISDGSETSKYSFDAPLDRKAIQLGSAGTEFAECRYRFRRTAVLTTCSTHTRAPPDRGRPLGEVGSLRYFFTVGSETLAPRAIESTLAPLFPSLLISPILSTPIISFSASHRRSRSYDNVRPRWGWSAYPRSDPKLFRAHSRKNAALKPARQRLSETAMDSRGGTIRVDSRHHPR